MGEDASTAATIACTTHVNELVDRPSSAYLALDAVTARDADPALLVVFALGAIVFYVFCDERRWVLKVANDSERNHRLRDEGEVLDRISTGEGRR